MISTDAPDGLRLAASASAYRRFCGERAAEINERSASLGLPVQSVAAAMFSLEERRREREELYAPEEVLVGFGSTSVASFSSVNISVRHDLAEERLRLVRLEVPPEVADHFLLTNIRVGKNSQFISCGAVPLSAFAADAERFLRLECERWIKDQLLTVSVTNQDRVSRNFQGVAVCWRYWGWQGMGCS